MAATPMAISPWWKERLLHPSNGNKTGHPLKDPERGQVTQSIIFVAGLGEVTPLLAQP